MALKLIVFQKNKNSFLLRNFVLIFIYMLPNFVNYSSFMNLLLSKGIFVTKFNVFTEFVIALQASTRVFHS